MSIDTDWKFKADHWEKEAKRLIAENSQLKSEVLLASALHSEKEDLIKTVENLADLVESRVVIIDALEKALETIAKGDTTTFDEELQCDVEVALDEEEMREIARNTLSTVLPPTNALRQGRKEAGE